MEGCCDLGLVRRNQREFRQENPCKILTWTEEQGKSDQVNQNYCLPSHTDLLFGLSREQTWNLIPEIRAEGPGTGDERSEDVVSLPGC